MTTTAALPDRIAKIRERVPLEDLLAEYGRLPDRAGKWQCPNPDHPDEHPSCTHKDGMYRCWSCSSRGDVIDLVMLLENVTKAEAIERLARRIGADAVRPSPASKVRSTSKVVASYRYVDEAGSPLFEVVRLEPKDFRQRRPDGTWGVSGVRRVLYRLPEVIAAIYAGRRIFVVEGEKDADAVVRAGEAATCNVGGAGKWRDEYVDVLRDAGEVVVVADRDEPGRNHASAVAKSLRDAGVTVDIVEPLEGKDVSDHLAAGHTLEQLVEVTAPANVVHIRAEAGPSDRTVEVEGDQLNAQRFLDGYGVNFRYCPKLGWFRWNGAWWQEDDRQSVYNVASVVIDGLRRWAGEATDLKEFERRSKHYKSSATTSKRKALVDWVSTDPKIIATVEELDAHPMLLACRNGTVDLTTGELRPASRSDLLTRGVNVDYDPNAWSDEWIRFLDRVLDADAELVTYCQRLLGYCVTGVVTDHILPVLIGAGANGKSTLVGIVQDLLGGHAVTAPQGLLVLAQSHQHEERIAVLRGRRLCVTSELEARSTLAEGLVKWLTGGDTLTARAMYGERFDFKPNHKMLLVTNHRPQIYGTDDAIWRRVKVVPFEVTIPLAEQDQTLRRRMVEDHGPAVLAWLVDGAKRWSESGLGEARAVSEASAAYRQSQDRLALWLDEACVVDLTDRMVWSQMGPLWDAWQAWCAAAGEKTGRKQDFRQALESHGFTVTTGQRTVVHGAALRGEGSTR